MHKMVRTVPDSQTLVCVDKRMPACMIAMVSITHIHLLVFGIVPIHLVVLGLGLQIAYYRLIQTMKKFDFNSPMCLIAISKHLFELNSLCF